MDITEDVANNNYKFPYEITKIDEDVNKKLLEDFKGERTTFVQIGPKNYFFPAKFLEDAPKYYNFEPRKDDIWIVTFPRSGTTWTQEMVWLLANNFDYKTAKTVSLNERCPFLEFGSFVHEEVKLEFLQENDPTKKEIIEEVTFPEYLKLPLRKSPRIIKTHLPFSLLPPNLLKIGCKVIYVARNPKDVINSFYHLNKLFKTQGYEGNLRDYCEYFIKNLQPWTPYWEHLKEGYDNKDEESLLFMFYEDLLRDCKRGIKKVADFIGCKITDDELDALKEHLDIKNFKNNPSVNNAALKDIGIIRNCGENSFIRNGKSGSWKNEMDQETINKIDFWINENQRKFNIKFPE
ncbi:sulfotransferase 1C4-like [Onthophagus taurus]|uniref:sulfotransferase 1C4-like n=1 Tax=Onthophagus taurus TaxID=166361 RepID=UPI0039BE390C